MTTIDDLREMRDDLAERADQMAALDEPLSCEFPEGDGFCGADGTIFAVIESGWSKRVHEQDRQPMILACPAHVGPSMGAPLPAAYEVILRQEQA